MGKLSTAAFVSFALLAGLSAPPALAQPRHDYNWQGDRDSRWDPSQHYRAGHYGERRLGRDDRVYRGRDGHYYCRRSDGTTGLVVGAIAGGLVGNAIGGNTLGTLLGAGGGALLGRSIERGNYRCR